MTKKKTKTKKKSVCKLCKFLTKERKRESWVENEELKNKINALVRMAENYNRHWDTERAEDRIRASIIKFFNYANQDGFKKGWEWGRRFRGTQYE